MVQHLHPNRPPHPPSPIHQKPHHRHRHHRNPSPRVLGRVWGSGGRTSEASEDPRLVARGAGGAQRPPNEPKRLADPHHPPTAPMESRRRPTHRLSSPNRQPPKPALPPSRSLPHPPRLPRRPRKLLP